MNRLNLLLMVCLVCLGLFSPNTEAAPYCKINGGTNYELCFPATQITWIGGINGEAHNSLEGLVFSSPAAAAEAVAQLLFTRNSNLNHGILWEPYTAYCVYSVYCGQYTNLNPDSPYQYVGPYSVVAWGIVNQGTPGEFPVFNHTMGLVSTKAICPTGYGALKDLKPSGKYAWFCANTIAKATVSQGLGDSNPAGNVCSLNPVDLSTGAKIERDVDYTSAAPFPIVWARYYNSNPVTTTKPSWRFSYDRRLNFSLNTATTPPTAEIGLDRPDGGQIYLKASAPTGTLTSYTWVADFSNGYPGAQVQITDIKDGSGHVTGFDAHFLNDEIEHYDAQGVLQSIENRQGNLVTLEYDSEERIAGIEDDFGNHLTVTYSPPAAESNGPTHTWNSEDPLNPTHDETYTYYPDIDTYLSGNQLASISDGTQTISYGFTWLTGPAPSYTKTATLTSVTHEDGTQTLYHYGEGLTFTKWYGSPVTSNPPFNALTGITSEDGVRFASYYYSYNQVVGEDHGNDLWRVYPGTGGVVDGLGNVFSKTAGNNGIKKVGGFSTKPCPNNVCGGWGGQAKSIVYDTYGNPLTVKGHTYSSPAQTGATTVFTWDAERALPLTQTEASGDALERTTSFTWDPVWHLPLTQVEPIKVGATSGTRTTTWTRDTHGNATTVVVHTSTGETDRTLTATYDNAGNVLTSEDALGHTDTFTYNTQGWLTSASNALSQTTTIDSHNVKGQPTQWTDPNGLVTKVTYDLRQRPTLVERGTSGTHWESVSLAYLATGLLSDMTQPNGRQTHFRYDAAHRLVGVDLKDTAGALLGTIDYTLDKRSLITAETWKNAAGTPIQARTATYDEYSRLATDVGTAASGETTTITYDLNHNPVQVQDPLVHKTKQTYDILNRALVTTDALNHTATLAYDPSDHVVSATDPNGHATTYTYNGFGELTQIVSPDAGTWQFSVDGEGRRTGVTDARGATTTTTYDAIDRPTQIVYSDSGVSGSLAGFTYGSETQTFTYDTCTHGKGHLCAMTDASGATSYSYDLWGRVTGKTFVPAGSGLSLSTSYTYDAHGLLTAMTYPSGKVLTFGRDSAKRPLSLAYDGQTVLQSVTYRPVGEEVTGWSWGASSAGTVSYQYDLDGRVVEIADTDTRQYGYDLASRLTSINDPVDSSAVQVYSYDAIDRLINANLGSYAAAMGYTYDNTGNRLTNTDGVGTGSTHTTAWTVAGSSNRVTTETFAGGTPLTWTSDSNGNLIDDGNGLTFSYDAKNRLVETTTVSGLTTYRYDAAGQRTEKTSASGTEIYVYDPVGRLVGVYDATGSVIEELIYLDGWRAVATVRNTVVAGAPVIYPILTDHLATPRKVLDPDSGLAVWSWDAKEPFGNQAPVVSGGFVFNARFPGQRYDSETGLYHNGFRTYNPKVGRYVQSDPLGLAAGWNTFAYVGSGPLGAVDPWGLKILVLSVNGKSQDILEYKNAITHLKSSKIASALLNYMEKNNKKYYVNIDCSGDIYNNKNGARPAGSDQMVNWNRRIGMSVWNPFISSIQPPSMGLIHELYHAYRMGENPSLKNGISRLNIMYEEENTVNFESAVAIELGYPTRPNHFVGSPVDVGE